MSLLKETEMLVRAFVGVTLEQVRHAIRATVTRGFECTIAGMQIKCTIAGMQIKFTKSPRILHDVIFEAHLESF